MKVPPSVFRLESHTTHSPKMLSVAYGLSRPGGLSAFVSHRADTQPSSCPRKGWQSPSREGMRVWSHTGELSQAKVSSACERQDGMSSGGGRAHTHLCYSVRCEGSGTDKYLKTVSMALCHLPLLRLLQMDKTSLILLSA